MKNKTQEEIPDKEEKFDSKVLMEKFIGVINNNQRNRGFLSKLSNLSEEMEEFGLASQIRIFEKENFSEPEEVENNEDKIKAHEIHTIMGALDINASPEVCYLFMKAVDLHNQKGLGCDFKDVSIIKAKKIELYGKG